ncbi:MAG: hypothetical protein CRN43_06780 [Candidatus Nephrothrix sp. EaCA]|nr:MAG: hypothetical protein CRN43_06780 [Candidatus Nephrothrix sp. EaCA]
MHFLKGVNKAIFYLSAFLIFFIACENASKMRNANAVSNRIDSLYYQLSEDASVTLDMLVGTHQPRYIYLLSNSDENKYCFSFHLLNPELKSEKYEYILKHSNRFLRTKKNVLKILLDEDALFLISPENKRNWFSHPPMAGITVNARGELLDYFSEEYKLDP